MKSFFNVLATGSAILMVITILMQSRGSSLGASFGGDSNFYRSRRGAEKVLFQFSIATATIFVLSIVLGLLSKN